MTYKENSLVIDKDRDPKRTHLSDALGYLVWQECGAALKAGEQGQAVGLRKEVYVVGYRSGASGVRARKEVWRSYRDLYAGGEQFKLNAQRHLIPRQREPGDVYAERLMRVFYENYIGSIVDWYAATLFRREPVLTFEGTNERGRRFSGSSWRMWTGKGRR